MLYIHYYSMKILYNFALLYWFNIKKYNICTMILWCTYTNMNYVMFINIFKLEWIIIYDILLYNYVIYTSNLSYIISMILIVYIILYDSIFH